MIDPWEKSTGLPYKLTPETPESERARYKVVRRCDFTELPGLILTASIETGNCMMRLPNGAAQEFICGPDAIRIVRR